MKAIALFFVLPCFIPGYHGLRLAPAWVGAVPEVPQGPEEVLSLETLERNHLFYHGTPVLVCNLLGRLPVEAPPQGTFARRNGYD